ncbi:MAG: plastocyanin/azurin family copper-binding protein [Vicinamibacterales bacterium]
MSRPLTLLVALLLTLAVAGCQNAQSAGPDTAAGVTTTPGAASTPIAHDGRRVEISADDTMKFSLVEIHAKAGERISVTLINKGTTPKFSMGHNWILLAGSAEVDPFLAAAAEAPTSEYVPALKAAQVLASTKLLGPGEQDTATFTSPRTPGRFTFLCSYPGHAQVGMRGVLIVD